MGRQKSTPKKVVEAIKPVDYFPVHKKRKIKSKPTNPSYSIIPLKDPSKIYHLGELLVGTSNNTFPEQYTYCFAQFLPKNEDEIEHLVLNFHLESSKVETTALIELIVEAQFLKDLIISKSFAINITNRNQDIFFNLYFTTLPLPKLTKKLATCIQTLFSLLYNIKVDSDDDVIQDGIDEDAMSKIEELYKNVRKIKTERLDLGSDDMQHPLLKPKLRPYQESAVRWMLYREKQVTQNPDEMHPLYTKVTLKSGTEVYYDKYTGYVDSNKPTVLESSKGGILADEMGLGKTIEVLCCILQHPKPLDQLDSPIKSIKSGSDAPTVVKISRKRKIFQDEIVEEPKYVDKPKKLKIKDDWVKSSSKKSESRLALETWYQSCLTPSYSKAPVKLTGVQCICGCKHKSNQVICVDCNKIQHSHCFGYEERFGEYRCPQCWMERPLLDCGATLIVTPTSLRTQWCGEICKHVSGDFKILQYEGSSMNPIYPSQLLDYDVVITTYSVLQSDLRLTENEKSLTLRGERKYSPPGSCLTRVKWWRLCLDEAQTVEVPSSMVSSMAHKLEANFRWAVTGTPISKDVSDLYGLVDYLHIEPYNDPLTWKHILYDRYTRGDTDPMYEFLATVLWRSSKNEIIDQINIPKQSVQEHFPKFSAVEQYFYKCEHSSNCDAFLQKVAQYDPNLPLQSFDRSTLKKILAPLLTLRQICTYPNSVRTRYLATKKPVTSMKDLLDALILKNTTESEEFLRAAISSCNGLAGIHLLQYNPKDAVEEYRRALSLHARFTEEETVAKLTVDKLQIIHTMYNLNEVLGLFPYVGRTLRDDQLKKTHEDLEKLYIKKFIDQSHVALQECLLYETKVDKLQSSFVLKAGQWYCDILDWVTNNDYTQELNQKITNAHKTNNVECTINLSNYRGMLYTIATWDENIGKLRQTLLDFVNNLFEHCPEDEFVISISQELVQKATDCHLRPQKKKKPVKMCPVCEANGHLKSYEVKLFHMSKRAVAFEEMSLKGSWKPSSEEIIFKSILSLGNSKNADSKLLKDGKAHIRLLDELKKEFKEIRKLWTYLDQQVCAQDELNICKMRLRLKDDNPEESKNSRLNTALRNLNYEVENRLETINLLSEHELDYQRTVLQNEERQSLAKLEKNLGVRNYLETLKSQQYEGQTPDPCPICKNTLEQHWSIISCGHSYCLECIQSLIEQTHGGRITCSVCRASNLVSEISYIRPGESKDVSDSHSIRGNYSTKVEAIVRLMQLLRSEDENVKVLVFSTWVPVLSYIKSALINNNVECEMIQSGQVEKQIEKFKDVEQGITALLLPIHLGAKGLNLIEATHVVLVEPLLNPGDELQAIGRVHRIGQTKPTFVHKFVVETTIEESIHNAISSNAADWQKNKIILRQLIDLFVTATDSSSTQV